MSRLKTSVFTADLQALADPAYRDFTAPLIPDLPPERILGVRMPALRSLAKQLRQTRSDQVTHFLAELPHAYYDENNLHGLLIAAQPDFDTVIRLLDEFLPHVDNWATCDLLSPKIFKTHTDALLPHIRRWMDDAHPYTVRFGIEMLMTFYMGAHFQPTYLDWVAAVPSDTYYVKMMVAWYMATALTHQYEAALPILTAQRLPVWTHNKAIQKARESRRIPADRKAYLNTLKRR